MASQPPGRPDEPTGDLPPKPVGQAPPTASAEARYTPPPKSKANRNVFLIIVTVVVVALIASAIVNRSSNSANPAPPGFAAGMAGGWKHGESLGATNVFTDTDRQDVCIVAGRIVGSPYDGQVAAWDVSPCSAVGNIGGPRGSAAVIAANSVAIATNKYGDSVPDGAPASELRTESAVQDAIDGV
jgi:hypothetical protein